MVRLGVGLALVVALAPTGLNARDVPANKGWVTDEAGLLNAGQEQALEQLMESYKRGSTHEIALLTVASLEGERLEEFALRVTREWKLGAEQTNNAALLVVARDERKLRIEVGRGLEGDLPDALAGRIIRDVITPLFKQGRMADGLAAGIEAMHAAIGGDYAPIERGRRRGSGSPMGFIVMIVMMVVLSRAGRRRGAGLHGRRGSVVGPLLWMSILGMGSGRGGGFGGGGGGGFGGGGFSGFGGGGGFSGGGASGGW